MNHEMRHARCSQWIVVIAIVAVFASAPAAQGDEATQRAMIAKYAGSYDTGAFLKEPAVRAELHKLLGSELTHLLHNLNVKGAVDLSGETLSVNGNAPHQGTEEEAIVCVSVLPLKTIVEAAIFSKGAVTVFSRAEKYEYASICIKDWITLANSRHADRFVQPANVRVVGSGR
jgi:hypothetical protein